MKIKHYITIDLGSGPVSFVELDEGAKGRMLRITHDAKFDKVVEVDADRTRAAVDGRADLGSASTRVRREHAHVLSQEVLRWIGRTSQGTQALRWKPDGEAVPFLTEEEACEWQEARDALTSAGAAPAPARRRVMMD